MGVKFIVFNCVLNWRNKIWLKMNCIYERERVYSLWYDGTESNRRSVRRRVCKNSNLLSNWIGVFVFAGVQWLAKFALMGQLVLTAHEIRKKTYPKYLKKRILFARRVYDVRLRRKQRLLLIVLISFSSVFSTIYLLHSLLISILPVLEHRQKKKTSNSMRCDLS